MTSENRYVILLPIHEGGGYIYVLILLTFSIFLSYYLVLNHYISIKSKHISDSNLFNSIKLTNKFFEISLEKYKNILKNLDNPYGIDFFKFKLIKFILTPFVFILYLYRFQNMFISIIYSIFIYFTPNLLIYIYSKNESLKIIDDISEVSNNLKLALSCNIPLYESLKYVKDNIIHKRFKKGFEMFIDDYLMYNFNMTKAIENFKQKFSSYEFNMLLNIIFQGEKEGKIIESLTIFSDTLDLSYFKYLKYKEARRVTFVIIASMISLINITILAIYPIIIQISENLQNIFN